jgi:hypothetical protein
LYNSGNKSISISLQLDTNGDNIWKDLKTINLEAKAYRNYIFDKNLKGEWVRLVANKSAKLTAAFHFTDSNLKKPSEGRKLFDAIADIDFKENVSHSKLYSNKNNYNLSVYSGEIEDGVFITEKGYEFTKYDFSFINGLKDSSSVKVLKEKNIFEEVDFHNKKIEDVSKIKKDYNHIWEEDEASVILNAKTYRLRLPKGHSNYSNKFPAKTTRITREVESEREIANICGTFYELPLVAVGKEPLYKMMRPIATHNKQITEFNTWNGLFVMSGVRLDAPSSNHIYKSDDSKVALWFGGIDDIWNFGKPLGEGGPWKNTLVNTNEFSDMYIMTGYDEKSVKLKSDVDTEFQMYIHINHYLKKPMLYKTFKLKAGETQEYKFPRGFSAHWVQLKSTNTCSATAWFEYK